MARMVVARALGCERVRRAIASTLAASVGLAGCGQFRAHRKELERMYSSGRFHDAADLLDEERSSLYRDDQLLWHLDRGAVALGDDDPEEVIRELNVAEAMIDLKREADPDEVIATWLVSERARPYIAEPYEDMYVNVLKLLAQLEAGRIDGYATVEARRLAWKADHLRDLHEAWAGELNRRAIGEVGRTPSTRWDAEQGDYVESPLGSYLSAIAFMEAGEPEMQGVAARRLIDAIEREDGLVGPVDASAFEDLDQKSPDDADLLVVALSGRAPTKVSETVGPIIIYTVPIYFELPRLQRHPTEVAGAVIEIEGHDDVPLELVEDLSSVAIVNHERYLPLVYTRTLLRVAVKAAGTAIGAEAVSHDDDSGLAVLGVVLGGLLLMAATEQADLRSWIFLPGQARVALVDLPEGTYRIRTVYRSSGGGTVYSTEWREVEITPRGLRTLVEHYWR